MTLAARALLLIGLLALLAGGATLLVLAPTPRPDHAAHRHELRPEVAGGWIEYQSQRRAPADGTSIPIDAYHRARAQRAQMGLVDSARGLLHPAGAKSTSAPAFEFLGPVNRAGRARVLVFDPRNSSRMLSAGVSGGLWQSIDGGLNWTLLNDLFDNINVGALALDPSQPNVIYVGTGELYRNSERAYSAMGGQGLFRSTDDGQSFYPLVASQNDDFRYVAEIVISTHNPNRLYVATNAGVFRSDNRGASFVSILRPTNADGVARYEGCTALLLLPDPSLDRLLASCSSRSRDDRYYLPGTLLPPACDGPCPAAIFLSEDAAGSAQFTEVLSEPGMGRVAMAHAPSAPQRVYAVAASIVPGHDRNGDGRGDYDNGLHAVYASGDGGRTWHARLRNSTPDALSSYLLSYASGFESERCGFGEPFIYGAGWYNLAIAVDPLNPESVWVAGMEPYRSDDGGRTFGKAGYWWLFRDEATGIHADQHRLVFDPNFDGTGNRRLFAVNDGGVALTPDARARVHYGVQAACGPKGGMVEWRELTRGLGTIQFYAGAVSANSSLLIGGSQDNGTLLTVPSFTQEWTHIYGGDGAEVAIDPRTDSRFYVSAQNVSLARTDNGGARFVSAIRGLNDTPIFIMPYVLDQLAPDRLYAGATRLWRTNDQGRNWFPASQSFGSEFGDRVSALAVSTRDSNRMLIGNQKRIYFNHQATSSNASTLWPSSSPRAGWVSSLTFDPVEANVAYATYSSFGGPKVYKSDDGGMTWNPLDGEGVGRLPDLPVHTLAIDPRDRQRLFIGTDLGIYTSIDGGRHWAPEHTGFPNVIVERLRVADEVATGQQGTYLYAFTYGRGAWRVKLNQLQGQNPFRLQQGFSGLFYDPAQDGHGWFIETVVIDGVLSLYATWYMYNDGAPHWVTGTGPIDGQRARVELGITDGADFPPGFDPATVNLRPFGSAEFEFDSFELGRVRWSSVEPGFNDGQMPLQRLSRLAASDGLDPAQALSSCHSGAWFNPKQNGHGLKLQVIDGVDGGPRRLAVSWFVYDQGEQLWLVGIGDIVGTGADVELISARGGDFPPAFDAAQVQRQSHTRVRLSARGADLAELQYQRLDVADAPQLTLPLNRISYAAERCAAP